MQTVTLAAQVRNESGKGASRRLRVEGLAPAIFYGYKLEPMKLAFNAADLIRKLGTGRGEGAFVNLQIDEGGRKTEKLSIIKELQVNTYKRQVSHADFYEVRMDRKLIVDIPVVVEGQPSDAETGAEVQLLKREVKLSALPSQIPDAINLDVSQLKAGDALNVEDIQLGDGVEAVDAGDVAILMISVPKSGILSAATEEGAEEAASAAE